MSTTYAPTRIEVFRPALGEEEIEAAAEVIRSGWIGRGPVTDRFEAEWARHIGVGPEHVLSVSCATEGLYQIMAWLAAGADPAADVVVPTIGFIGTASAVLETSLTLQLCDVDARTLNPRPADIQARLRPPVAGVLYQHYGGFSDRAYAYELRQLCALWQAPLVEDFACHPLGRPIGDFAVWSFDAMKVMSTGDGGMIYCRDAGAADDLRQWTRLGMDTATGQSKAGERWWEFTARFPGRRAMMNDIQSAIGRVQLKRLPDLVARRATIWAMYQDGLAGLDWLARPPEPEPGGSYYTYWVQAAPQQRDGLSVYLRERGIYTTFRYWPIHRAYGWAVDCPNSDWAAARTLNLPLHPGLTNENVADICAAIRDYGRTL